MRPAPPTVFAVIPVYGRDDVLETVPNLLRWHTDLRIVVVDNGNGPDRAAKLAALAGARVEVVRLDENRGGSGGYIAGMRRALARKDCGFVWLLDDDAEPNERTLPGLVAAYRGLAERGERVASVGSAMVSRRDPETIVECGALYLRNPERVGICRLLGGEALSAHAAEIVPTEYCAAFSCLIARGVLEEVGLWEDVFIHYDDVEWGLRAERRFGLRNFATTASTVVHPDRMGHVAEWLQYYDMYNKLWLDRQYSSAAFAKDWFIGRMYELFARALRLNRGKYAAYRLVMSDFRAGRRRRREEVAAIFAAHGARGNLELLSLPRWYVWLRKRFKKRQRVA